MSHQTLHGAEELINLVEFPIHQSRPWRDALIKDVHVQLAADGCAVLKRFLTEQAVTLLTAEADSVGSCAHRSSKLTNPYFTADEGGLFEYAPNIRADSENFTAVRAVLDGDSDLVRSLALESGDLQIFKGRYSLHRVTPCRGPTPRDVAIFSYV